MHKRVRHVRHGKDPEEMGGTNIDGQTKHPGTLKDFILMVRADPNAKRYVDHFVEEIKEQFRSGSSNKK